MWVTASSLARDVAGVLPPATTSAGFETPGSSSLWLPRSFMLQFSSATLPGWGSSCTLCFDQLKGVPVLNES